MNLKIIFTMFFLLFLVGCQEPNQIGNNPEVVLNQVQELSNNLNSNSKDLRDITTDITSEANSIKKAIKKISTDTNEIDASAVNVIQNSVDNILLRSRDLNSTTNDIVVISNKLKEIEKKIYNISGDYLKLEEELAKAKEDVKSKTVKMLQGIIGFGVIGFGISVALFFLSSPKIGIAGASASVATIVLAMGISKYFVIIALSGAVIISAIVIYLIIEAIKHKKAITEVVKTVEAAKDNMTDEEKVKIFGEKDKNGVANEIQSSSTKSLVKRTKNKIKKIIISK